MSSFSIKSMRRLFDTNNETKIMYWTLICAIPDDMNIREHIMLFPEVYQSLPPSDNYAVRNERNTITIIRIYADPEGDRLMSVTSKNRMLTTIYRITNSGVKAIPRKRKYVSIWEAKKILLSD